MAKKKREQEIILEPEKPKRVPKNEFKYTPIGKLKEGQFVVKGEVITRTPKSVFCISEKNKLRVACVNAEASDAFNNIMMVSIILNSVTIALHDHSEQAAMLNSVLQRFGFVFTAIYVLEALIKIIANGFVFGKNTYLRNPFNIFDFAIVISSLVETVLNQSFGDNVEAIQTFRTLRALRVLKLFTGFYKNRSMREQIRTLMRAMRGLFNVLVFLCMFFLLLAIIGL